MQYSSSFALMIIECMDGQAMIFLTFLYFRAVAFLTFLSVIKWMDGHTISFFSCKVCVLYVVTLLSQTPMFGFIARLVVMKRHQKTMHGTMRLK
jgi:hypothetical protein